jgi:DNA-binding NtrC family response regulator
VARIVLLVDDDDAIRRSISAALMMAGYAVVAVDHYRGASGRSFDLAIIDVKMPPWHPHGLALGRMARLRRPNLRFVFISGYPDLVNADTGEPLRPVLLKPARLNQTIAAVGAELAT